MDEEWMDQKGGGRFNAATAVAFTLLAIGQVNCDEVKALQADTVVTVPTAEAPLTASSPLTLAPATPPSLLITEKQPCANLDIQGA